MAEQGPRDMIPEGGGFIHNLTLRLKLVFRLLADPRISPILKLIPFGSFLYLIIPEPILGPIDDATVLGIGLWLFVEMCPPEIVQEHMDVLTGATTADWGHIDDQDADIVDGEFRELE